MIIDSVRAFLVQQFFRNEAVDALATDQPLVSSGLLDSVATLRLVLFLEQEFEISIDSRDIAEGELETLSSIVQLVQRKTNGRLVGPIGGRDALPSGEDVEILGRTSTKCCR